MNLANQLTMLRIALASAMFVALMQTSPLFHLLAFFLCLAAVITDGIDGHIARKMNLISPFGKILDPIADKILIIGALMAMLYSRELEIPPWGVFLIIARDMVIGGVRALESAQGRVNGAEIWGKWKMGIQCTAVLVMILILATREYLPPAYYHSLVKLPYYLTVLCVAVAWGSAWLYIRQSRKFLEKSWG
jgi:CDP-diacylglycerol---glycerol-3-phosphate 3-phosphatidyltransferase